MTALPSDRIARINRRQLLKSGITGTILISAGPIAYAQVRSHDLSLERRKRFGSAPVRQGRVTLTLPPIAENGYSVPLSVTVDSPMTQDDHVTRIAIFSPRNPVAHIASFHLGPQSGSAHISTRIRLGGTQTLQAIAEMSDGTLWSGSMETVVTLAACIVL